MQLNVVLLELYHDKVPVMPEPVMAYGVCHDEERVVVMIYEDALKDAA